MMSDNSDGVRNNSLVAREDIDITQLHVTIFDRRAVEPLKLSQLTQVSLQIANNLRFMPYTSHAT